MLDYAIVVATRNRRDMLALTLPLFARQSRAPRHIVVVDRSDDHDAVRELCDRVGAETGVPVQTHYGEAANLPAQRNQGLDHVDAEVTMLPDDDSMWFEDTAEHTMRVYEADAQEHYGAVSAVDVYAPPSGPDDVPRRHLRLTERPAVMRMRNAVEAAIVPQPFEVYGRRRTAELADAARAAGLSHPYVGTFGGYRMSLRTGVAKRLRFDPVLGSRVGYGIHEDKDMALRVLRDGTLIAVAEQSRVFHNAAAGKRAGGIDYGFYHILNYAYVCRKVMPDEDRALSAVARYLRYKVALYRLRREDAYDRDVRRGAAAALQAVPEILATPVAGLPAVYARVSERALALAAGAES